MPVIVHEERCNGCNCCAEACPYTAISVRQEKAVLDAGCTNCGVCIDSCESDAIALADSKDRICMDVSLFEGISVFIEHEDQAASEVSLELLGKARELSDEYLKQGKRRLVTAILIAQDPESMADELIRCGADHVIMVEGEDFRTYRTDIYTKAMVQIIGEKRPEILLFGATPQGRDLAPRVANRLRTGLTADCTALEISADEGILLQTLPAFGSNIMATIVCPDHRPQMATVRPGVMKKMPTVPERNGTKEVMTVDLEPKDFILRIIDAISTQKKSSNLEDARIIVAGGHGVSNPEGVGLLKDLAAELGGELGATRAAVDTGLIGPEYQIGQTGKMVKPDLYIACGISGSLQHIAGMSQSKYVISINTDRKAPIVAASDVTFIGDIFQIVPMLTERIREYKQQNGSNE